MRNTYASLKYRRQFVAGPSRLPDMPSWRTVAVAPELSIYAHPDTRITKAEHGSNVVVCVGVIVSTEEAHSSVQDIVDTLCKASSFDDIERTSASHAGRWLLFIKLGNEIRLYPDATALLPVFYAQHESSIWIASQPQLLQDALGLQPNRELIDRFSRHKHGSSWPGSITSVSGVSQLWPNHYLDFNSGRSARFWPVDAVPSIDLDDAAQGLASRLELAVSNAAQLKTAQLWLTGGYDSRVLFAVSRRLHSRMGFCILDNYKNASYDRTIASNLARLSGRTVEPVRLRRASQDFWNLLHANGGNMAYDPMNFTCSSRNDPFDDRLHVFGWTGEIGRCFYYTDGQKPANMDPRTLCKLTGHDGNPVTEQVFESWLDQVDELGLEARGIDILDLLYWEHRLGAWASMMSLVRETFTETMAPFNCRAVFETMLGTNAEYRIAPFELFRKICEISYPETLDQPFNWSMTSEVFDRVSNLIPWRIRNFADQLMARRWGVIQDQIRR